MTDIEDPAELLGSPIERREDPALLTGDAEYTDDIQYPRMAHMVVLRSQYAHADIERIDTIEAEVREGVFSAHALADNTTSA
jgi:carbon-monoxide dehydrogenase large subunit